jgi:hypothetical protein
VVKWVSIFTSLGSSPSSSRFMTSSSFMLGLDPSSCLSNASRMSFGNSTSSSELSMLSSEQSALLSILETWGSFGVSCVILEWMTDGKGKETKKGRPFILYDGVFDCLSILEYLDDGVHEINM